VSGAFGSHAVRVETGSRLSQILGRDGADLSFATPTHHHQGIDKLGSGLIATAWAEDGTIEAFEPDQGGAGPFLVAVQWHPEAGDDPSLFRAFVAAARDRASVPAPA
jgi:putative glutamine amidotransferase